MTSTEEQLAVIGFGKERRESSCWHTVRLGPPVLRTRSAGGQLDPADSRALALWRGVLAREPRTSPYRVRRVTR
jgi:hypothetical protein